MKAIFFLVFLHLIVHVGTAQQWTTYTVPIPGTSTYKPINAVAIDAQGNKWCATGMGAYKFDGTTFTKYDTSNSGIAHNFINDIAVEGSNIWFATNRGVSSFNGINWTTYNTSNSPLLSNYVSCVTIAPNGDKWFGGEGAYKLNGSTWTIYDTVLYGGQYTLINAIAIDAQNNKWFVRHNNLTPPSSSIDKLSGNTITQYNSTPGFSFDWIDNIAVDAMGNKWLGASVNGGGFYKFDGANWSDSSLCFSGFTAHVTCIVANEQDLLVGIGVNWATDTGLYALSSTGWQGRLAGMSVTAVAVDEQGKQWVGTDNGKLMTEGLLSNVSNPQIDFVAVSPNPSTGTFTVSFETEKAETIQLKVYDLLGQLIKQESPVTVSGTYAQQLNLTQMPKGIYLLQIKMGEESISKRIEIQ